MADVIPLEAGHTYRIEIQVAWSRRARRRGAHHAPKGWGDVKPASWGEAKAAAECRYERLRQGLTAPLAADGLSYHRRYLARRRRRS